jgi:murein DD-endopeptidase MepM/ murein hydrolase activator NlpD
LAAVVDIAPADAAGHPQGHRRKRRAKHHRKHKLARKVAAHPAPAPAPPPPPSPAAAGALIIPVQGVLPDQLVDGWAGARSGGRTHDAIDIMAPRNTPVLAAAAGTLIKLAHGERGGNAIYQLGSDGATVYYYAHLDHFAEGLVEGAAMKQGDVIAFVGDTGNAKPGNYHLHFAIWRVEDVKRYWEGENVNPYLLLRPN